MGLNKTANQHRLDHRDFITFQKSAVRRFSFAILQKILCHAL